MARTSRTFSRRSHSEAEAGEDVGQGKPRGDVIEKTKDTNQQEQLRGLTDWESEPLCWSA